MSNLITLTEMDGEQRISSCLIAEHIGTTYKATNNLIRTHKNKLESLGEVPFQKAVGERKNLAYLNEDQAIFLMTLSKNTEQVVEFKYQLVKAFSALRRKQAIIDENHAKVGWQQNRELGKLTHRDNTDTIKDFISYATAQGSQGYQKNGYPIIGNMINTALEIDDRDNIDEQQLHLLATAELICNLALERGMAEGLPYKSIYKQAKHDVQLFTSLAMIKVTSTKKAPTSDQTERSLDNAIQ
jgi:phage regulator Rha-like protein